VDSLQGKLLLILGGLSPGAMSDGLQLVEALQKANKDVDLICMPNMGNSTPNYTMRRTWDYLVRHLEGVEPPHHFEYLTGFELIAQDSASNCESDSAVNNNADQ
jgi:dipeptidyl-peptidase-4